MSLFAKFCICFIIFMIFSVVHNMLFQGHAASESVTHKTGISDFNFVVPGDYSCNKEAKKTVNNMATAYLRHFNLTDPYYSFDYQNVHFLAMATAKNMVIPYMINSAQYDFVKNDFKSAHENKNVNWIVVFVIKTFIFFC